METAVASGDPVGGQPGHQCGGQVVGQPEDDQGEEDADGEHLGGVLEGRVHARPRAPVGAGRLFMTPVRFDEPNDDMHSPVTNSSTANSG